MRGNGIRAGQNAFSATFSITAESLPPEKRSTGCSNSAATSRKMWIDSASSASRWLIVVSATPHLRWFACCPIGTGHSRPAESGIPEGGSVGGSARGGDDLVGELGPTHQEVGQVRVRVVVD